MSVRLTCGRSWVRSPSVPLSGPLMKLLHKSRILQFNLCFGSACGSVGIGRRARLRILCWLQRVGSSPIFRTEKGNRKIPFFLSLLQYNGIRLLRNGSSAGMSVRLTRERSWVRTPSVPLIRPCVKPGTWKCPDFTQGLLCMHISMQTKKVLFCQKPMDPCICL